MIDIDPVVLTHILSGGPCRYASLGARFSVMVQLPGQLSSQTSRAVAIKSIFTATNEVEQLQG